MIMTCVSEKYGPISYEESIWTGKRKIIVNGILLKKEKKKIYTYCDGDRFIYVEVIGSILTGIKLKIGEEKLTLLKETMFYEYFMMISPLIPGIIFLTDNYLIRQTSNPILNSALIGGFKGALVGASVFALIYLIKRINNIKYNILITIGINILLSLLLFGFNQFLMLII